MIQEYFYVLGRGRHVRYRHGAMMRLRHELVIGQFYIDGGRGSGFFGNCEQEPSVARCRYNTHYRWPRHYVSSSVEAELNY